MAHNSRERGRPIAGRRAAQNAEPEAQTQATTVRADRARVGDLGSRPDSSKMTGWQQNVRAVPRRSVTPGRDEQIADLRTAVNVTEVRGRGRLR